VLLQVDGTPGERAGFTAGVGVVVRTIDGTVLRWETACVPARTSNEAEYQALIVGLRLVRRHFRDALVYCLTDSRVVVDQLSGHAAVRAEALQPLHREAVSLMRRCRRVTLIAIPRELNRLADALAWEALGGRRRIGQLGKNAAARSAAD